jgi:glycosyltransferase involved in cell wall biosynthesis
MKINYLKNPTEDKHISMIQYIEDLMDYQKNYSKDFLVTDYVPKFNKLLNILPNIWKMRIARYISYPMQIKKLPMYDITHVGDQGYSHLVNCFKSKVKILTVNDLIPLVFEKKKLKDVYNPTGKGTDKNLKYLFRYSAKHFKYFDRIIAISENTKKDILKFSDCPESKISVINTNIPLPYFNNNPVNKQEIYTKYNIPAKPKKILIYGTGFYKNNITSIKVLENLINRNVDVIIIWIGHKGDITHIKNKNIKGKIIQLPVMIPRTEIPKIFKSCDLVLYPSLYEGMGNLTLEAMRCGVPIICSNTSAFPEIAGDDEIMCDPLDDSEITNKILKLFNDSNYYNKKIEDGLNRSKLFSYTEMHEKIINLYREELLKKTI